MSAGVGGEEWLAAYQRTEHPEPLLLALFGTFDDPEAPVRAGEFVRTLEEAALLDAVSQVLASVMPALEHPRSTVPGATRRRIRELLEYVRERRRRREGDAIPVVVDVLVAEVLAQARACGLGWTAEQARAFVRAHPDQVRDAIQARAPEALREAIQRHRGRPQSSVAPVSQPR